MQNLTYKSVDVMKKSKDTLTSQLLTAEKQALVKTLATIGINQVSISVPLDDTSVFVAAGSTPSPRTAEAEVQDWCDVIHAQQSIYGSALNVTHRGSFGGVENIFNVPYDQGTPIGSAAATANSTDNFATLDTSVYTPTGAWSVVAGELIAPAASGWTQLLLTQASYVNFTVQAKLKAPTSGSTNTQLAFRTSTSAGYGVQIRRGDGVFRLERWGAANLSEVAKTFVSGSYYQVKVTCSGTSIKAKVWLDGDAEPGTWDIDTTDATYSSGQIGFSSEVTGAVYDNLIITPVVDNSSWCGRWYSYLYNHVGSHVISGDVFAPVPEGTTHAFDGHWFVSTQAQYSTFFKEFHKITTAYGVAKGVSVVFQSHNNFSEVATGYINADIFSDQSLAGADYYGQRQGSTKVQPADYVYDWQQLYLGKDSNGGGSNNAGGVSQFWAEWGDLPSAVPAGAEDNEVSWAAFLNAFYTAIRDNLVSPYGHMIGFNYWGGWEGQNTSLLTKTGSGATSVYALNFRGQILKSYFSPADSWTRVSKPTSSTYTNLSKPTNSTYTKISKPAGSTYTNIAKPT